MSTRFFFSVSFRLIAQTLKSRVVCWVQLAGGKGAFERRTMEWLMGRVTDGLILKITIRHAAAARPSQAELSRVMRNDRYSRPHFKLEHVRDFLRFQALWKIR